MLVTILEPLCSERKLTADSCSRESGALVGGLRNAGLRLKKSIIFLLLSFFETSCVRAPKAQETCLAFRMSEFRILIGCVSSAKAAVVSIAPGFLRSTEGRHPRPRDVGPSPRMPGAGGGGIFSF